ncbi:hypothetical protein C8R44DRAFT_745534 [Mycena epipterygia]|nr:hypothetical protein C8R44DRAFT_745534 [Mycena epipterygia]
MARARMSGVEIRGVKKTKKNKSKLLISAAHTARLVVEDDNPPNAIPPVESENSSEDESSANSSPILSHENSDNDDFPLYEDVDMPDYILTPLLHSDAEDLGPREHTAEGDQTQEQGSLTQIPPWLNVISKDVKHNRTSWLASNWRVSPRTGFVRHVFQRGLFAQLGLKDSTNFSSCHVTISGETNRLEEAQKSGRRCQIPVGRIVAHIESAIKDMYKSPPMIKDAQLIGNESQDSGSSEAQIQSIESETQIVNITSTKD